MGEISRDRVERQADEERPATGYHAALALLAEYDRNVPPGKLSDLVKELEACAGASETCQRCAYKVECKRIYDELIRRIK